MGLFKEKKKVKIKAASSSGAEISPLRPKYAEKHPPCVGNCPGGTDVRGWLTTIAQAEDYGRSKDEAFEMAWNTITECNPFPAICGRVCPHPCEDNCNRKDKDGAVAINAMERHVGDFGLEKGLKLAKTSEDTFTEKVAVVGAGPAGLSCAYHLARRGYPVTVMEAFDKTGGMLRYGIPRYRLPAEVMDGEFQKIWDMGVELKTNYVVGKDISMDDLRKEYRAVFVGIGAHKGKLLRCPGEDAPNVYTGTEFLNHANSGKEVQIGKSVIVIGGGDTAIDAARMSKRLGAEVTILYRRTRKEMPAIEPEIEGALEEGITIEYLAAPTEVLLKDGMAVGMKAIRMELGEPDSSGRRRPVPIEGSEYELTCDSIIAAISQEPDFEGFDDYHEGRDWIKIDEFGRTNVDGVFAGGDNVDLGLVSIAIGQGRFAATAIDAYLRGKTLEKDTLPPNVTAENMKLAWYKDAERHERDELPVDERGLETEIQKGLSPEEVIEESKRCMSCGLCMDCETCWMYCTPACFEKLPKGEHYKIKLDLCNGCKKCAEECPCGYIEMV